MIGRIIFVFASIFVLFDCAVGQSALNVDSQFVGRQLLEVKPNNTTNGTIIHIANCSLIYIRDMVITDKAETYKIMVPKLKSVSPSGCKNNTGLVVLALDDTSSQLSSFNLRLEFGSSRGSWYTTMGLSFTCKAGMNCSSGENNITMNVQSWNAPLQMSYHCSKSPVETSKSNNGTNKPVLMIGKIQLQPFEFSTDGKFDVASDCTPYFTIPTLSVLFVSIILLLIISFGIGMISNIKTMDRFDDPKGKHFQIGSSTE